MMAEGNTLHCYWIRVLSVLCRRTHCAFSAGRFISMKWIEPKQDFHSHVVYVIYCVIVQTIYMYLNCRIDERFSVAFFSTSERARVLVHLIAFGAINGSKRQNKNGKIYAFSLTIFHCNDTSRRYGETPALFCYIYRYRKERRKNDDIRAVVQFSVHSYAKYICDKMLTFFQCKGKKNLFLLRPRRRIFFFNDCVSFSNDKITIFQKMNQTMSKPKPINDNQTENINNCSVDFLSKIAISFLLRILLRVDICCNVKLCIVKCIDEWNAIRFSLFNLWKLELETILFYGFRLSLRDAVDGF